MTRPALETSRLFIKFSDPDRLDNPHYFYLVREINGEAGDGQLVWYYEVRRGIYRRTDDREYPMSKPVPVSEKGKFTAAIDEALETKRRDGYTFVSESGYRGLYLEWLRQMGLSRPA
jgi:hypothetical protein